MELVALKNINKTFQLDTADVRAVVDASLTINDGEFVAIMGQSGSGKTTLLNIIGLLDRATSGEYALEGRVVSTTMSDREQARLRSEFIGFVFQNFNLLPNHSALANVALPAMYYRPTSAASGRSSGADMRSQGRTCAKERASLLMEQVGLSHRLHARPYQLSGGERQRIAIARALMNRPRLLLADEPTGNLDSTNGKEILSVLEKLNQDGMTLILVTHSTELARRAHRILHMRDGRII